MKLLHPLAISVLVTLLAALPAKADAERVLTVGMLAFRPKAETAEAWNPLIQRLSQSVPGYRFRLMLLDQEEIQQALQKNLLDFVLTNPAHYIALRQKNALSGVLATLIPAEKGVPIKAFGGVIVVRADRGDITQLKDLHGKSIACVSIRSTAFGGDLAQMYEIEQAKLPRPRPDQFLVTGMPHDRVIDAVLSRCADAGFVRTGVIEQMTAEGRLDPRQVKVINRQDLPGYPYAASTRLYPEWPFVALAHVDEETARKVAAALLVLKSNSPEMQAAKVYGFGIPEDYLAIETLMREMRVEPFEALPVMTWHDLWEIYFREISIVFLAVVAVSGLSVRLIVVNHRLAQSKSKVDLAQAKLSSIYNVIPDALYIHEIQSGKIVECNDSACRALVRSRDEILGLTVEDVDCDFSVERDQHLWQSMNVGSKSTLVGRHRRCDGTTFPVEVSLTLAELDGRLLIVAAARDIGERYAAEEALRQSEENLQMLIEQAGEAIYVSDASGRFLQVNKMGCTSLGYTREELLEMTIADVNVEHEERDVKTVQQRMQVGDSFRGTTRHRRKDGTTFPVEINVTTIRTRQGIRYLALAHDVSRQIEHERELLAARESAESANRAKSDFLANMSHEIRTPMNGIIGMAQLMRFTDLSPEQQDYLESIEESSQTLLALISDILDLSKIEAGKVEVVLEEFGLRSTIGEVVTSQTSRLHAKGLALKIEVSPQVPDTVVSDELRLKQVLLNLIGNAVKFTAQGEITVRAALVEEHEDHAVVEFSVQDTGIGIAQKHQDGIFAPFSQGDSSTTRRYGGTGLGLSICRRLVEVMGGRIWVESQEGVGSTFHFVLPLTFRKESLHEPQRVEEFCSRHELPTGGEVLHILLVEDNLINRKTAGALLQKLGHRVEMAENGLEAIAAWQNAAESFDVILMDVQMPEMDGIEALKTMREKEKELGRTHTRTIALTAHALKEDRERLLKVGFDGYLSKPIGISALAEALAGDGR